MPRIYIPVLDHCWRAWRHLAVAHLAARRLRCSRRQWAMLLFTSLGASSAAADCATSGPNLVCQGLPEAGIERANTAIKSVTVNAGAGATAVLPGVAGIVLRESGGQGTNEIEVIDYGDQTVMFDHDGDAGEPDGTDDWEVLADEHGNPVVIDGYYLRVLPDERFELANASETLRSFGDGEALAAYLLEENIPVGSDGGAVSGSLTINHHAAFETDGNHGITISSAGGRGGNGGCTNYLFYTSCRGGRGGSNAGSVAVNHSGEIIVRGDDAYGIRASSVGGAGGNGGGSFGLFASSAGSGGHGGKGGDVAVLLNTGAVLQTYGKGGHGVFAYSTGGDGGNGGRPSGAVALGEKGGNGGDAGDVSVSNYGEITTHGEAAHGIFAQSVGAGAGSGSSSGGLVALGGNGGGESSGGAITVANVGTVVTHGLDAYGILAQSIGGGGGNGGSAGGLFSVGGRGGSGGGASLVALSNTGTVQTGADGAVAILAQSIGGGGGNGGNAVSGGSSASVALGGAGGLGGDGGGVVVNQLAAQQTLGDLGSSLVETHGHQAHGIQAQSIGGGGGNGGMAVAGSVDPLFSASVAMGGRGGRGGSANAVTVNQHGVVSTGGDHAYGIFAQSVGGGGGSGGGAIAGAVSGGASIAVALGGSGGEGGHAGAVNVNLLGDIVTQGVMSFGMLAQSIGGGGGNGGFSAAVSGGSLTGSVRLGGGGAYAGHGRDVSVVLGEDDDAYRVHTSGEGAHGVLAQSVGGGGGNGGMALAGSVGGGSASVALGGSGAGGGRGGEVLLTNHNQVLTGGDNAFGLIAQSIGGGGGNGGFALGAAVGVMSAAAAVGGSGGGGGDAGDVSLSNHGTVMTTGNLSYGVLAQSVGGGGGNGGSAIAATVAISIESIPAVGASVAIGGAGGTASRGGDVVLDNTGSVQTGSRSEQDGEISRTGHSAHALFAQSVGGGGGTGGFAGAGALALGQGMSFAMALGGSGGAGGDAGAVSLTSSGEALHTFGDGADGIHAQSIGGGGGDAGFGLALAAGLGGNTSTNVSASLAIGGSGGDGGTGNTISVDSSSRIMTDGDQANGILAQSIGGGGGSGGFAVSGTVTISGNAGQVGVAIGGKGGTGSVGDTVQVSNAGEVITRGEGSLGILAQSIGGGGGNGGLAVTGQIGKSQDSSAEIGWAIGGDGGTGNAGGRVEVMNLAGASITTFGLGAHGIEAQSVGGGGGRGGLAIYGGVNVAGSGRSLNVGASVGGWGGDGGLGGLVGITNAGNIRVHDDSAMGIVAQSVGGGGGDGGDAYTGLLGIADTSGPKAATYNIAASVGGEGGSGNHGGAVQVENSGSIITGSEVEVEGVTYITGIGGYGIFAQSVGGGGGIGGRANSMNVVYGGKCTVPGLCEINNSGNNMALTANVGGFGGAGGDGDRVDVINTGSIVTLGDTADGIFAQSIGGGGGIGGNGVNGIAGGPPLKSHTAFYKDISVTVGGNGGASGDGGEVQVHNSSSILTRGANSNGIFAQSVGGGGGTGGLSVIGLMGKVGLGGEGGAGGDGERVQVWQDGGATIETQSTASHGIFAQSIGGGGGIAGNVDRMFGAGLSKPLGLIGYDPGVNTDFEFGFGIGVGLALGRAAGDGGDGGAVDVSVAGNIVTRGDSSAGVFAQSVGGGGGVRGELGNEQPVLNGLSWHIGSNGDAGDGGAVDVSVDGNIVASGNSAQGVFAQSSGGQGVGGDVTVELAGAVVMAALLEDADGTDDEPLRGLGATGVLAHSAGQDGNGNIHIHIAGADSLVRGGRSAVVNDDPDEYAEYVGIGLWLLDGQDNVVSNHGTIMTANGVHGGRAIYASGSDPANDFHGGNETIDNYGHIIGSVDLGAGHNAFNNFAGAQFDAGKIVRLGSGNTLRNEGRFEPGGAGVVMTSELAGGFQQGSRGYFGLDLDLARTGELDEADRLNATGDITLAGELDVRVHNITQLTPGAHSVVIAASDTGLYDAGLAFLHPISAVAKFDYSIVDGLTLQLDYGIDFQVDGLNGNQSAMGAHFNNIQLAGGSPELDAVVNALFHIPDEETYAQVAGQMLPSAYLANEVTTLYASQGFANRMLSCRSSDGDNRFVAEQECAWLSVQREHTRRDATRELPAWQQDVTSFGYGVQAELDNHRFAGFAVGYDKLRGDANRSMKTDGTRFHLGAVFKVQRGNSVFAGSLSGGLTRMDVMRSVAVPGLPNEQLEGTQKLRYLAANAVASRAFQRGDLYLKPMLGIAATHVGHSGYTERGGSMALRVQGDTHTYFSASPAVELGGELALGESLLLRPYLRAGVTAMLSGDKPRMTAALAAAPGGAGTFTVTEQVDDLAYDVAAGVDLLNHNGFALRMAGTARTSEHTRDYGGQVKISLAF